MDLTKIIELLAFTLPAVVTGLVAAYFFKSHVENENKRRNFLLRKENNKQALPLRLQAFERLALFLERISLNKLLIRVKPTGKDPEKYSHKLIGIVEQEFEHNLSQQIYVTDQCWNIIIAAKNATIQLIRKANMNDKTDTANKLREVVLTELMDKPSPSNAALSFIKEEVGDLW